MSIFSKTYLLVFLAWGTFCIGMQPENAIPETLNHFMLPPHVETMLKGGIDRLINAERMRRCIEEHGLSLLHVPQKYLHVNEYRKGVDVYAEVITQNQEGKHYLFSGTRFSFEEIQQLAKFVSLTGYCDFGIGNLVRDCNGKLFFLDTEDRSFYSKPFFIHECLNNLERVLTAWTDEASRAWIKSYKEHFAKQETRLPLPLSDEFDSNKEVGKALIKLKNQEKLIDCLLAEQYQRMQIGTREDQERTYLTPPKPSTTASVARPPLSMSRGKRTMRQNPYLQ